MPAAGEQLGARPAALKPLRGLNDDIERLRWVEQWRKAKDIPERFVFAQADHELLVDSRHAPSILSWLYAVPRTGDVTVCEWLRPRAGAGETIATELMIPLRVKESARRQDRPVEDESVTRVGSDSGWMFGKLYCAQGMADRLLYDVVGPTAHALSEAGMARAWFYVRYGDPHFHIRLRLRMAENVPSDAALGLFSRLLNEALVRGDADDYAIVTYEREVGRYGGAQGIDVVEEIFCAESGHLVRVCAAAPDGVGQSARFWCVFQSIHDLLESLVPDLAARIEALRPLRHHFVTEQFQATDSDARRSLAKMLRHNQLRIAAVLARGAVEGIPDPARQALEARRQALTGIADLYRHLEARGELTRPLHQIAGTLCHMTANRLFARQPRRREAVVYDLLLQTLRSQAARERVSR